MKIEKILLCLSAFTAIAGCVSAPQNSSEASNIGMSSSGQVASQIPPVTDQLPSATNGMIGNVANSVSGTAPTPSLVNVLVQQLGISPQQATGGAGSIFSVAKKSMSPMKFAQVSNAVPGMGKLLAEAPALSGSNSAYGGLMGSAANAFGGSSLGNMALLIGSFQSLGMNAGMMNQFIPVILQYIQGTGGSSTMGLLQSALMP
jgi:Protein of unknown function VcgC/VcgE (DUF2780)